MESDHFRRPYIFFVSGAFYTGKTINTLDFLQITAYYTKSKVFCKSDNPFWNDLDFKSLTRLTKNHEMATNDSHGGGGG